MPPCYKIGPMPLDEATKRFLLMLQGDLARLQATDLAHETRGEKLRYDSVSRFGTYEARTGNVARRLYGELLATFEREEKILKWAWVGRAANNTASATHVDAMFREAHARSIPQLTMSVVGDLKDEDAIALARLGAVFARAETLHVRDRGDVLEYIGLFERPRPSEEAKPERFSVPPPPVSAKDPRDRDTPKPARAIRSIPPIREIAATARPDARAELDDDEPSPARASSPPVRPQAQPRPPSVPPQPKPPRDRESVRKAPSIPPPAAKAPSNPPKAPSVPPKAPSVPPPASRRDAVRPVANAALTALAQMCEGYKQALVVLNVEPGASGEKRRFFVQLVAIDADGLLQSLDPPTPLVDAAAVLLESESSLFRKLTARFTPKPDGGATLVVDVA